MQTSYGRYSGGVGKQQTTASSYKVTTVEFGESENLTDVAVVALANNFPLHSVVRFSDYYILTDVAVVALANNCSQLTDVSFDDCYKLTDVAVLSSAKKTCLQIA